MREEQRVSAFRELCGKFARHSPSPPPARHWINYRLVTRVCFVRVLVAALCDSFPTRGPFVISRVYTSSHRTFPRRRD